MSLLLQSVVDVYEQEKPEGVCWIAYSGGLDSQVLLHLMVQLRAMHSDPITLKAIHINHSLSPNALAWAEHCAQTCRDWHVEFVTHTIDAKALPTESPEDTARRGRYAVFKDHLQPQDLIFAAHHQDDQAETLLLQLARGAGPKGLAAMPSVKPLGLGRLARPLLDHARDTLRHYAEQQGLSWVEDESNTNTKYARNFMRHDVIQPLKQRWPSITATLARSALHCAEAQTVLEEVAADDLVRVQGDSVRQLSTMRLLSLSPQRQRLVLRYWLETLGFPLPSAVKLNHIQHDLLQAAHDKTPVVQWAHVELRRYQDTLYALHTLPFINTEQQFSWDFKTALPLGALGCLQAQPVLGSGLRADIPEVTIRFRQGGEVCRLPGRDCTHSLKKLFQTWQVPTWERAYQPLVYVEERLVAIPGLFLDAAYAASAHQVGYALILDKK